MWCISYLQKYITIFKPLKAINEVLHIYIFLKNQISLYQRNKVYFLWVKYVGQVGVLVQLDTLDLSKSIIIIIFTIFATIRLRDKM